MTPERKRPEDFLVGSAGEADSLDTLGFIAHRSGDHLRAIDHYRQALALNRIHHHTYQAADTFDSIGYPYAALGQLAQARDAWREALDLYRAQGRDIDAQRVQRQLDNLAAPNPHSTL